MLEHLYVMMISSSNLILKFKLYCFLCIWIEIVPVNDLFEHSVEYILQHILASCNGKSADYFYGQMKSSLDFGACLVTILMSLQKYACEALILEYKYKKVELINTCKKGAANVMMTLHVTFMCL